MTVAPHSRSKQDTGKRGSMMMIQEVSRAGELKLVEFYNNFPTAADECRNLEVGIYTPVVGSPGNYTYRKVVRTNDLVGGFNTASILFLILCLKCICLHLMRLYLS